MDNLERTSDPVEAADVTAASGQSEGETQAPVEQVAGDAVPDKTEAVSYPWEKDERFKGKNPDEMYKIVSEADKYKGQLSQKAKLADALSEKYGLTPEKMEQIMSQEELAAKQAQYDKDPNLPLKEELDSVKRQIEEQKIQSVVQQEDLKLEKYINDNPEYETFKDDIRRLGYTIERDSDWPQIAEKYFGKAIVAGQESAYRKMGVKQSTQAAGVSKAAPKGKLTPEDMENMTVAEMEAILPHADVSNRPY